MKTFHTISCENYEYSRFTLLACVEGGGGEVDWRDTIIEVWLIP